MFGVLIALGRCEWVSIASLHLISMPVPARHCICIRKRNSCTSYSYALVTVEGARDGLRILCILNGTLVGGDRRNHSSGWQDPSKCSSLVDGKISSSVVFYVQPLDLGESSFGPALCPFINRLLQASSGGGGGNKPAYVRARYLTRIQRLFTHTYV